MKRIPKSTVNRLKEIADRASTIEDRLENAPASVEESLSDEAEAVHTALHELNAAIVAYNDALSEKCESLAELADEYTGLIDEVAQIADEAADSATIYADDKSDRWNDSEKGQDYHAWIGALGEAHTNAESMCAVSVDADEFILDELAVELPGFDFLLDGDLELFGVVTDLLENVAP